MPTYEYWVRASADDAYEDGAGAVSIVDTGSEMDAANEWYGCRFQDVRVPQGSTITSAILSLVVVGSTSDEPDHPFYGVDADDTGAFTTGTNDISGRARTTATVTWSSTNLGSGANQRFSAPDMATIVQEIVDRPGWAVGNALAFVAQGSASATRDLGLRSWDFGPSLAAKLTITFTPPAGMTAVSLQVGASADDADETSAGTTSITNTGPIVDATTEWMGWRFQSVAVPQGATIVTAALYLTPIDGTNDKPDHTFYAEDADDAAAFSAGVGNTNISGRARTTATAVWASADLGAGTPAQTGFFLAPEMATLVQEVVDRGGWSSGNDLAILCHGSADANRDLGVVMYDSDPAFAAKLEIIYEAATGPEGSGALVLPFLTMAGAGAMQPEGEGALTLPFLTMAGAGAMQPEGEGALTLPFLTMAGEGEAGTAAEGSGALTLPFLTMAGAGAIGFEGSSALVLPFLTMAAAGALGLEGAGAVTLPFLSASGVGLMRVALGEQATAGATQMTIYNPDGDVVTQMTTVLAWETRRKLNSVGQWKATIPAAEPVIDGDALGTLIERGWRVDIIQEGTHPLDRPDLEYLLYQGLIEDKSYQPDESGQTVLELSGSFRGVDLASRNTPTSAEYVGATIATIAADLVSGEAGGITLPADASTRTMTVSFNTDEGGHVLGRYHRLLRIGEYARYALRETWFGDALEFVPIDNPPDSGYTMLNVVGPAPDRVGRDVALIGGTPEFRREGRAIVNRVIPFGKDIVYEKDQNAETFGAFVASRYGLTPVDEDDLGEAQATKNIPLTLAHATLASPYTTVHGTNGGIHATATMVIGTRLTAADTFTIDGTAYTVVASGASSAGQINRGANVGESRANIKAAINGTDGWNTAHATVECGAFLNADVTLTARTADDTITQSSTFASPSNTLSAFGYPSGLRDYYYLEDTDSIARHGLVEMSMHRSDVANPNPEDGAATRVTAANVLYQLAVLELQKHRFPKLFVTVPVANGAFVWALPGDSIGLQYAGNVVIS